MEEQEALPSHGMARISISRRVHRSIFERVKRVKRIKGVLGGRCSAQVKVVAVSRLCLEFHRSDRSRASKRMQPRRMRLSERRWSQGG